MKAQEIREMTGEELVKLAEDTEKRLFDINVKHGLGEKTESPVKARGLRRDLARIKTILREREASNG